MSVIKLKVFYYNLGRIFIYNPIKCLIYCNLKIKLEMYLESRVKYEMNNGLIRIFKLKLSPCIRSVASANIIQ